MILIITNHSFYTYGDIKKTDKLSLESNYFFLANFSNDFDKLSLNLKKKKQKKKYKWA